MFILCVWVFCLSICLCTICVHCLQKPEEEVISSAFAFGLQIAVSHCMGAGTQTPAITTSALKAESSLRPLSRPHIIFMTFFVDDSLVFISNIVASLKNCFSSHRVDIRVRISLLPETQMSKLVECLKPSLSSLYGSDSLSCFTSPASVLLGAQVHILQASIYHTPSLRELASGLMLESTLPPLLVLPLCCPAP